MEPKTEPQPMERSPLNKRLTREHRKMARQWAKDAFALVPGTPVVLKLPLIIEAREWGVSYEYVCIYYKVWYNTKRGMRAFAVDTDGRLIG